MKYRVSLLPEYSKKRINNRKKIEKIQRFSLVVLVVLALFTFVVMSTNFYAQKKLAEINALNEECAQEVAELEQFREINANLQDKVKLIESIQIDEPQLVNFIAKVSNLKHPGISIATIDCSDWKVTRNCVLSGTCDNRAQYLAFEEAVKKIEGVSVVNCTSYTQSVDSGVQFSVSITCTGGSTIIAETTEAAEETTAAAAE